MRTGRPKAELTVTEEERRELESLAKRRRTASALSQRARMVLAWAAGLMDEPRPGAQRQFRSIGV